MTTTTNRQMTSTPYAIEYFDIAAGRVRTRRFADKGRAQAFQLGLRTNATNVGRLTTVKKTSH